MLLCIVCSFAGSWFQWRCTWCLVPWCTCWPQNLRSGGKPLMRPVLNHLATFICLLCIRPRNRAVKPVVVGWLCQTVAESVILMPSEIFSAFNSRILTPWYFHNLHFFKLLLISSLQGAESVSVITGSFLLPFFFCSLCGINQPTSPGQTASPDTGRASQKSLSLLWTGHWSSRPARGRSFCYKLWFTMPWWWVSSVLYWLMYSDVFFFCLCSLLPFLLLAAQEKLFSPLS